MLLGKVGSTIYKMTRKCALKVLLSRLVALRWCNLGGMS